MHRRSCVCERHRRAAVASPRGCNSLSGQALWCPKGVRPGPVLLWRETDMSKTLMRLLAIFLAFGLIAAACGDDDEEPTATEQDAEEPAEEEPAEEEPA